MWLLMMSAFALCPDEVAYLQQGVQSPPVPLLPHVPSTLPSLRDQPMSTAAKQVMVDDVLFVSEDGTSIKAISLSQRRLGKLLWSLPFDVHPAYGLVGLDDHVVALTYDSDGVQAAWLGAKDGKLEKWVGQRGRPVWSGSLRGELLLLTHQPVPVDQARVSDPMASYYTRHEDGSWTRSRPVGCHTYRFPGSTVTWAGLHPFGKRAAKMTTLLGDVGVGDGGQPLTLRHVDGRVDLTSGPKGAAVGLGQSTPTVSFADQVLSWDPLVTTRVRSLWTDQHFGVIDLVYNGQVIREHLGQGEGRISGIRYSGEDVLYLRSQRYLHRVTPQGEETVVDLLDGRSGHISSWLVHSDKVVFSGQLRGEPYVAWRQHGISTFDEGHFLFDEPVFFQDRYVVTRGGVWDFQDNRRLVPPSGTALIHHDAVYFVTEGSRVKRWTPDQGLSTIH